MGLAASQARYLALTARKSDLEYQSQTINTRRIQLAYKTADIARAYSEGMNNQKIMYSVPGKTADGKTTETWKELTFQSLVDEGYALIGINGSKLEPEPYKINSEHTQQYNASRPNNVTEENSLMVIDAAAYTATIDALGLYVENEVKTLPANTTENKDGYTQQADGSYKKVLSYKLKSPLSKEEYNKIKSNTTYAPYYKVDNLTNASLTINDQYENNKGMDIQSLLVSGKAQIVTKGFFNYLVEKGYNYQDGMSPERYAQLLNEWQAATGGVNPDKEDSVVDWRSDETNNFKQRNYTEDDADVLAKYEAATAEIQAQDKVLEVEEKNIETQHKAIETEMENVKKVIQKNMEETFKIFS